MKTDPQIIKQKKAPCRCDKSRKPEKGFISFYPNFRAMLGETLSELTENKDWDGAIQLLQSKLAKHPDNHWLMIKMAAVCFDKGDDQTSMDYLCRATSEHLDCPLVVWEFARTQMSYHFPEEAINAWMQIIEWGPEALLQHRYCAEGFRWAATMVNDCHYLVSRAYKSLRKWKLSANHRRVYLLNIQDGIKSNYDPGTLKIHSSLRRTGRRKKLNIKILNPILN